jgi:hypothetical protein
MQQRVTKKQKTTQHSTGTLATYTDPINELMKSKVYDMTKPDNLPQQQIPVLVMGERLLKMNSEGRNVINANQNDFSKIPNFEEEIYLGPYELDAEEIEKGPFVSVYLKRKVANEGMERRTDPLYMCFRDVQLPEELRVYKDKYGRSKVNVTIDFYRAGQQFGSVCKFQEFVEQYANKLWNKSGDKIIKVKPMYNEKDHEEDIVNHRIWSVWPKNQDKVPVTIYESGSMIEKEVDIDEFNSELSGHFYDATLLVRAWMMKREENIYTIGFNTSLAHLEIRKKNKN